MLSVDIRLTGRLAFCGLLVIVGAYWNNMVVEAIGVLLGGLITFISFAKELEEQPFRKSK